MQKAKEVKVDNQKNMDDVHQRRREKVYSKQWNFHEIELHSVDSCRHHHHRKMMDDKKGEEYFKIKGKKVRTLVTAPLT